MIEKVEQFYIHKTEQKVQRFSTCLISTPVHSLLYYQHHAPEWYIVTNDKPALPHRYHPKSIVYISFHQDIVYSLGFDKYIMAMQAYHLLQCTTLVHDVDSREGYAQEWI